MIRFNLMVVILCLQTDNTPLSSPNIHLPLRKACNESDYTKINYYLLNNPLLFCLTFHTFSTMGISHINTSIRGIINHYPNVNSKQTLSIPFITMNYYYFTLKKYLPFLEQPFWDWRRQRAEFFWICQSKWQLYG